MRPGSSIRFGVIKPALLATAGIGVIAGALALAQNASQPTIPWILVLDRPYSGKYEDFAFPDARHGWLVSSAGDIIHTSDSGRTWQQQATGMGRLRSIDFIDSTRGFAGTISGQLFATADAGASWKNITADLPRTTSGFCGITHVGSHVHVVGKYTGGAADYFHSPDAGRTWSSTNLKNLAQGLVDVSFLNENVGFIGGMALSAEAGSGPALILKTTDGGRSWRQVFRHDGGRGFAWKIFPVSANLIYAGLQSQDGIYRVAKSTDGGDNWNVLTVATGQPTGPGIQGIGFIDATTGWVGGFFQGMWTTADGGSTWRQLQTGERLINRFERAGSYLFTAGTRGVLRYDASRTR